METTSKRLKQIMDMRGLKQVDILRLAEPYCRHYNIKLGKSDLSQFVRGKVKPGQSKLSILGMALNVSEGWLMGLPIPMERTEEDGGPEDLTDDANPIDYQIASLILRLPQDKKEEALRFLQFLVSCK